MRSLWFLTALTFASAAQAQEGARMTSQDVEQFSGRPAAEACRRIDFEDVQIVPGIVNDTWFAVVSGTKPWLTMEVSLIPLIYIEQPEYWGIEVIGCNAGIGLPATAPFSETISLDSIRGTKGVEIIGATPEGNKRFDIPPQ